MTQNHVRLICKKRNKNYMMKMKQTTGMKKIDRLSDRQNKERTNK